MICNVCILQLGGGGGGGGGLIHKTAMQELAGGTYARGERCNNGILR